MEWILQNKEIISVVVSVFTAIGVVAGLGFNAFNAYFNNKNLRLTHDATVYVRDVRDRPGFVVITFTNSGKTKASDVNAYFLLVGFTSANVSNARIESNTIVFDVSGKPLVLTVNKEFISEVSNPDGSLNKEKLSKSMQLRADFVGYTVTDTAKNIPIYPGENLASHLKKPDQKYDKLFAMAYLKYKTVTGDSQEFSNIYYYRPDQVSETDSSPWIIVSFDQSIFNDMPEIRSMLIEGMGALKEGRNYFQDLTKTLTSNKT